MTKDRYFGLLACVVFVFLFLFLGESPFNTKGEPREAVVAFSMLEQSNWILPVNNGVDIPYKPPFFQWCIALVSALAGGVTEYTARFPSALALGLMVLVGYRFFARRQGAQVALVMGLLTLTTFELHRAGTNCRVDMVLTAMMVLSLYALYGWWERGLRGFPWVAVLCMSCAVLTKGPVGMILPCLVTAVFAWTRGAGFWRVALSFLGVGLASCVLPLLWYVAAYQQGGERFLNLVMEENLWRFMGKMSYESHAAPAYYNVITLVSGFLPYTLLALLSLFGLRGVRFRLGSGWWQRFRQYIREMDDARLFSLVSVVVIFVFYCVPKSKRSVYLMPLYPFLAYFLAEYILYLRRCRHWSLKAFGHVLAGLSLGVLALFGAVRMGWVPETIFSGRHAADNVAYLRALEFAPIGWVGILLLALALFSALAYWWTCRQGRFPRWGLAGMFAVVFSLFMLLDGFLAPAILGVKSDKPVARRVAEIVPEGKLYSYYPPHVDGDPMRHFSLNFYLGNRVVPFESQRHASGYLVAGKEDVAAFLEAHPEYHWTLVYDSGHRSCDDRKTICLYLFERKETKKGDK